MLRTYAIIVYIYMLCSYVSQAMTYPGECQSLLMLVAACHASQVCLAQLGPADEALSAIPCVLSEQLDCVGY